VRTLQNAAPPGGAGRLSKETLLRIRRRTFIGAGAALAAPTLLHAQAIEKPKLSVAVGGKNLLY